MIYNRRDLLDRITACWMGKNIGGTLGAPFEWKRQWNDVSFYTQELGGEPLPNDDLDIQLLWLIALERKGLKLDAHDLAEFWAGYVTPHWNEYGVGKINMRMGLPPPLCGMVDNPHKDSCGAFIRSEIWACIAPGLPAIAATYAYHDAILDHGDGEGTHAAVFCAAMESAAFLCQDLDKLLDIGLSYIPASCGVARAVQGARQYYARGMTLRQGRDEMLTNFRGKPPVYVPPLNDEDLAKNFQTGQVGWDVPGNIGLMVLSLLHGGNDFGAIICNATNCGEDTDCTAATAGALFGIMHGMSKIPEKWITPIGRGIKTIAINLGDLWGTPKDIDDLTLRTLRQAHQLLLRHGHEITEVELPDASRTAFAEFETCRLMANQQWQADYLMRLGKDWYTFQNLEVLVDYGEEGPWITPDRLRHISFHMRNHEFPMNLQLRLIPTDGLGHDGENCWPAAAVVSPRMLCKTIRTMAQENNMAGACFRIMIPEKLIEKPVIRFVLEIIADSRPTRLDIPVTFLVSDNYTTTQGDTDCSHD